MTKEQIRAAVLESLHRVAPEADPASMPPDAPLREELDLDSMDFLNFVADLHARVGVDVPEADYAKLATLETCVEYLASRGA
jgi:acyl carrier protein